MTFNLLKSRVLWLSLAGGLVLFSAAYFLWDEWKARARFDIAETVFREMHSFSASPGKHHIYLKLEGFDPPREFMARFHEPNVWPASLAVKGGMSLEDAKRGGGGTLLKVERISFRMWNRAEVEADATSIHSLGGGGYSCGLERKNGKWVVVDKHGTWISYVAKGECIICHAPLASAPANISWSADTFRQCNGNECPTHCRIERQPETPEELEQVVNAVYNSCVDAIHYCGTDLAIIARLREFGCEDVCDAVVRGIVRPRNG